MNIILRYVFSFCAAFIVTMIFNYFFFDGQWDFAGAFSGATFALIALHIGLSFAKEREVKKS